MTARQPVRVAPGWPGRPVRAIVLPIVLVAFVLIALLALGFGFTARAEYFGLQARIRIQQAQMCARSGIETAALLLRLVHDQPETWQNNPDLFRDRIVHTDAEKPEVNQAAWRFTIVADDLDRDDAVRYGLTDEASKVNLNVASPDQLRRLPGMTDELADALLDWREKGDTPRPGGAKEEYYQMLPQPYSCKRAPLDTVEELLLIKGFTAAVVFGEDMNRNGLLDPNENDGDKSLPIDNGDGILDRGLAPYVTVWSREPEVCDSNPYQPRININDWPGEILSGMLGRYFDQRHIQFILKVRQAGGKFGNTPANLVGMRLEADNQTTQSPFTVDDLPAIMDYLTTGYRLHEDGFVYGRINVNTAPRTVLRTIAKLTTEEIDKVLATRGRLESADRKTIAWLVTQNVLSLEKFQDVAYLFTARSYQFRVEAVGYYDYDGTQARLEAVMELRLPRVQFIYLRDLTGLGVAYDFKRFSEEYVATQ